MVQPNSLYGNSVYFPYAAGSLAAYAFENPAVRENYELKGFFYKKENIADAVGRMENPFIVGFSCYVWNYEYNRKTAQAVKAAFPGCITVFGGHQVNGTGEVVEDEFVDYIITGEGEESFLRLLLALARDSRTPELEDVPNLIYKRNGEAIRTEKTVTEIPHRVSPYTKGLFDSLLADEKELVFSAVLETNRGCPNRCAFCDWGNIKSKIRSYDMETVRGDIDWISENKIEYCYCADANFGIFPRDEEIVEYLIDKHRETGYPVKFQATYSKNNPETVFNINRRLNEAGMCKGATLSFQSMNQHVLNNIYRKNMPVENFHTLMSLYTANHMATYSEIIVGLPGETLETFSDGIEQLLEAGQHMAINFFNCEMLRNSIMSDPGYIEKYKIKYVRTQQHQYHVVPDRNEIEEYSRIVVSTDSLTEEDWIRCNVLSVFVRAFHNLGLLQSIAIYLYYEKHIKYITFYNDLIDWSRTNVDTVCGKVLKRLEKKYREVLAGTGSLTCPEPEFGNLTWPLDEGAFLEIIYEYDRFCSEIGAFLKSRFDDERLYGQLFEYQKAIIKTPYSADCELKLNYDFYRYFRNIYENSYSPPEKGSFTVKVNASGIPRDLTEYAEKIIWFGRKGGQNIITDITVITDSKG